jgi:hypothetical protein
VLVTTKCKGTVLYGLCSDGRLVKRISAITHVSRLAPGHGTDEILIFLRAD